MWLAFNEQLRLKLGKFKVRNAVNCASSCYRLVIKERGQARLPYLRDVLGFR